MRNRSMINCLKLASVTSEDYAMLVKQYGRMFVGLDLFNSLMIPRHMVRIETGFEQTRMQLVHLPLPSHSFGFALLDAVIIL